MENLSNNYIMNKFIKNYQMRYFQLAKITTSTKSSHISQWKNLNQTYSNSDFFNRMDINHQGKFCFISTFEIYGPCPCRCYGYLTFLSKSNQCRIKKSGVSLLTNGAKSLCTEDWRWIKYVIAETVHVVPEIASKFNSTLLFISFSNKS